MAYNGNCNGDMCNGYTGSYESEGWGWGQQQWGNGYHQMQSDCHGWEQQQQQQQVQLQQQQPQQHQQQPHGGEMHQQHQQQHQQQQHQQQHGHPQHHGHPQQQAPMQENHGGHGQQMQMGQHQNMGYQQQMMPQQQYSPQMQPQPNPVMHHQQPMQQHQQQHEPHPQQPQAPPPNQWQEPQGQQAAPPPAANGNSLTDQRLAELRRLIDRDAQAIRRTEVVPQPVKMVEPDRFEAPMRHPEELAYQEHRPPAHMQAPHAPFSEQHYGGQRHEILRGHVPADYDEQRGAKAEPGCQPKQRALGECYVVHMSFKPENRNYRELPVMEGEEVYISSEPVKEWIWATKVNPFDEGWVPAMNILPPKTQRRDVPEEYGYSDEEEPRHDRRWVEEPWPPAEGGPRPGPREVARNDGKKIMALLEQATWEVRAREGKGGKGRGAAPMWKGGAGGWAEENQRLQHEEDRREEDEPWHHHGNWWSKQRHLKANEDGGRMEGPPAPMSRPNRIELASSVPAKGGGHRVPEWDLPYESRLYERMPPPSMGKGPPPVKGAGKGPAERPQRQRQALSSLLDRLNRPVTGSKYDGHD